MTQAHLQFRWEATAEPAAEPGFNYWTCKYELSLPLDEHDVRREDHEGNKVRDAKVIELGSSRRRASREPCINDAGVHYFDPPYYGDSTHARWDAPKLGNLRIVCIAPDGTVIANPSDIAPLSEIVTDEMLARAQSAYDRAKNKWRMFPEARISSMPHPMRDALEAAMAARPDVVEEIVTQPTALVEVVEALLSVIERHGRWIRNSLRQDEFLDLDNAAAVVKAALLAMEAGRLAVTATQGQGNG